MDLDAFADLIVTDPITACWLFRGFDALFNRAYPSFVRPHGGVGGEGNGKRVEAYTWLYELLHGPVPEGLLVNHKCEQKRCVNPDHLEALTVSENVKFSKKRKEIR